MTERGSKRSRGTDVDYVERDASDRPSQPVLPDLLPPDETTGRQQATPEQSGDKEQIVLESVTPDIYGVSFCCLLIPRFPSHYLMGDLVVSLQDWMPQICLSFDWKLERLSIKPAYMEWSLQVRPATSPGFVMRTIRRQTSCRIFEDYPRLKRENLSDDFWAPGFLITSGTQPHSADRVERFVKMTRHSQGISPH